MCVHYRITLIHPLSLFAERMHIQLHFIEFRFPAQCFGQTFSRGEREREREKAASKKRLSAIRRESEVAKWGFFHSLVNAAACRHDRIIHPMSPAATASHCVCTEGAGPCVYVLSRCLVLDMSTKQKSCTKANPTSACVASLTEWKT